MVDGQHNEPLVYCYMLLRFQDFHPCCFYNGLIGGVVLPEQNVDVAGGSEEIYLFSLFDVLEQSRIGEDGKRLTGIVFPANPEEDSMNDGEPKIGLKHPQKQGPERPDNLNAKHALSLEDPFNGLLQRGLFGKGKVGFDGHVAGEKQLDERVRTNG